MNWAEVVRGQEVGTKLPENRAGTEVAEREAVGGELRSNGGELRSERADLRSYLWGEISVFSGVLGGFLPKLAAKRFNQRWGAAGRWIHCGSTTWNCLVPAPRATPFVADLAAPQQLLARVSCAIWHNMLARCAVAGRPPRRRGVPVGARIPLPCCLRDRSASHVQSRPRTYP